MEFFRKSIEEKNEDGLEQQVERGNLFAHTVLSHHSTRINEIESFLYAIVDILTKKGVTPPEDLTEAIRKVREEMLASGEVSSPGIALGTEQPDDNEFSPVNCEERLPICKGVCCKLDFALSPQEVESGKIKWDLGRPYFIRQAPKTCYCTHLDPELMKCSVYDHRPSVCKKYSCAKDARIWKNFEKMELNEEWIAQNIRERKLKFAGAPMFVDQKVTPFKNENTQPGQTNITEIIS